MIALVILFFITQKAKNTLLDEADVAHAAILTQMRPQQLSMSGREVGNSYAAK